MVWWWLLQLLQHPSSRSRCSIQPSSLRGHSPSPPPSTSCLPLVSVRQSCRRVTSRCPLRALLPVNTALGHTFRTLLCGGLIGRLKMNRRKVSEFGNSTTVGPRKLSLEPTVEEFLTFVCP
ncbi:Hypothetical predicted protein [Cloeon dipterum]|uniref:Secreted protein n=1 Tax=Cloeon dipterum TaxID=197152 RepID=A0A8S1D8Z0_9INSE|nr:Hypothetical predicted protein [Cloeon dipterum]